MQPVQTCSEFIDRARDTLTPLAWDLVGNHRRVDVLMPKEVPERCDTVTAAI